MTSIENGESGASVRAKLNSALARYDQDGFANVAALLADTALEYGQVSAGDIIRTRSEGFSYQVATASASDHHAATAGGVKLYVMGVLELSKARQNASAHTDISAAIGSFPRAVVVLAINWSAEVNVVRGDSAKACLVVGSSEI